ncbi:MAG: AraC family transcriptional regulator, partial [Betaproteobacteria bacterium]
MNGRSKKPASRSKSVADAGSSDAASANGRAERVGFLLMPDFSMLSFAAVLEPLRMANRLRQTELYEWHHFSPDGGPVRPSNGIEFAPTRRLDDNLDIDTLIVVAGIRPMQHCSKAILAWLRAMANRGVRIGATSTGPLILASAGL